MTAMELRGSLRKVKLKIKICLQSDKILNMIDGCRISHRELTNEDRAWQTVGVYVKRIEVAITSYETGMFSSGKARIVVCWDEIKQL